MKYCGRCGTKLIEKELPNEGMIPFCGSCNDYLFPQFNVAVSLIVHNNDQDKILLIQQYGKKDFILVAGYVTKGETAETAAIRELQEETGLKVLSISFNKSKYYEPSNTLMLNYTCVVAGESLEMLNDDEVDFAKWFSIEEAKRHIKDRSLAQEFLNEYLEGRDLPYNIGSHELT